MASVDKSSDATNLDDNEATDASSSSCLNDPNYAIICVFLQKFGGQLKIEHPDFLRLQKMIENTDEVHDELKQFFVRLLRKTRKSVQPDKLDSALSKFCYTYSAQDAWEVERFGYKQSSLAVKLRILKEVLESQFDKNPNFRTLISAQTANELRSQPLGKDKLGNAYWSTMDEQCNLRIYQEHLDEEIWKVVATNRNEMAKLIACLKCNELVMPSLVGLIDEDSSSNSMPPKVDALQTENGTSNGTTNDDDKNVPCLKIKLNAGGDGESTVEQIANGDNTNGARNPSQNETVEDEEEEDASVMSEIDELSQAASESSNTTVGTKSNETQGSKRISLLASKPPSNVNKLKLRIFSSDKKTNKRILDEDSDTLASRSKRPSVKKDTTEEESEYDTDESSDEDLDENDSEDDEVGPAIEEPTLYVQGEGSGAANNCESILWPEYGDQYNDDDDNVGEAIEDEVFYVIGEGSGRDCDVGNNDTTETETPGSSTSAPPPVVPKKPMFFFGQAGCLKLSPMKPVLTTDNSSESTASNNDAEDIAKNPEPPLSESAAATTNDKNSVALDANNDSKLEHAANNDDKIDTDETDKGISANIEPSALTSVPQNNVDDKRKLEQSAPPSSNETAANETAANIELNDTNKTNETNVIAEMEPTLVAASSETVAENKEIIESNSSVALKNISVQEEENENVEQESLPTISEKLRTDSHSSNNSIKECGISNNCKETKLSESDLANDDIIENEPQPDPKPENTTNESSKIVNESNENQSSLSQAVCEPSAKADDTLTFVSDDVAIENQTPISSENSEIVNETNVCDREQESEDLITSFENNVDTSLVEKDHEGESVPHEKSTTLDKKESNNEVKTEIASEQEINEPGASDISLPVQETESVEITPVVQPSDLPESIDNIPELSDPLPEESITVDTSALHEAPETSATADNEPLSLTKNKTEQASSKLIESASAPIHTVTNEPLPTIEIESVPVEHVPNEPLPSEIETTEPIPIETAPSASLSDESEPVNSDNKEDSIEPELVDAAPVAELEQSTSTERVENQLILEQHEVVTTEVLPVPIKEKRKSIDKIEEPSECKKVCEQKITEEPVQLVKRVTPSISHAEPISKPLDDATTTKSIALAVDDTTSEFQTHKIETAKENAVIVPSKEESSSKSTESIVEIQHELSKIDEADQLSQEVKSETSILKSDVLPVINVLNSSSNTEVKVARSEQPIPAAQEIETKPSNETPAINPKDASPILAQKGSSSSVQLRNRKRRISVEKTRHLSESDDNIDSLIDSPLSQDASSDDEVGGKRIKMRPKVQVRRTTRKSIEHKRNVKDTDWSSDENEMPNAKRATSDVPKAAENVSQSPEKETIKMDDSKPPVKVEIVSEEKPELKAGNESVESPSAIDETKVKEEKEQADQKSDDEHGTPSRRPGRPARRGRKPGPKPKAKPAKPTKSAKPVEEVKTDDDKSEDIKSEVVKIEQNESVKDEKSTPVHTPATRRKKRSLLGLDIDEVETIQAAADDAPVRQSRRIAQIKIREEADRRKAEEVALQKMKAASEKKKGVVVEESTSEEENSESEVKLEKKKPRKKGNKDKPWQTNSDDSSEREEEDVYEHEEVERDRLEPLRSDHEFSPESDIEDESQIVPTKRARTARKDKTERREEESEEEEEDIHACQKCSKSDHPEWILLCDKCDKGYHCSCLNPVLFVIPEGNWFCPTCDQETLIDVLESKLVEFDTMIKQREIDEAQRQRLLLTTISEENVLKDTKRDRQRARNKDFRDSDESSESSSSEGSETEEKENTAKRRTRHRPRPNRQRNRIESSEQNDSSDNTSDNEPIYKLRKRRQANVSYRFNEYDELINRAIKSEMDEVAGAGNLGRGKDIATIMEADKEEKRLKKLEQQQKDRELTGDANDKDDGDSDDQPLKNKADKSADDSDSEPIRPKAIKRSKNSGRKKKKLNSLDDESDEADSSDDDFNTSSYSDEDEEDDSSAASDSSLDSIVKRKGKRRGVITRRSGRERKKRYDADFIDDSSFDDEDNVPLVKKKKKVDSEFSDFDGSSEEIEEDVDSEDLCDDSTDDSDGSWGKKKSKSSNKSSSNKPRKKRPDAERSLKAKPIKKKPKISDDESDEDDDEDGDEVLPKSRRTRGKKLPYLMDDDFDSSDDGIKPGVKRPDTPPEERAAFIKKQEEIKRMLAEKGDSEKNRNATPTNDSLSTIPHSIIQSAKALDVDLKKSAILNKTASDNDSNSFGDDLPEDFDPEDMDEDAIAKMMEEEEFAQHQLKLAGETIRNRKLKDALMDPMKKDDSPTKLTIETAPSVIMQPNLPPALVSPLPLSTSQLIIPDIPPSMYTAQFQAANSKITPKKRGRKTKDDIPPTVPKEHIQTQPPPQHPQIPIIPNASILSSIKPNTLLNMPSVLQHAPPSQLFVSPTIQHTSSVIAHASVIQQQQRLPSMQPVVPSILGIAQNREPIIPSTVLDVQNTRLLDPSELGKPPEDLLDPASKKQRPRSRKKITPTRESLITSPPNVTVAPGISQLSPVTISNIPNVSKPPLSILSERLTAIPVEKSGLTIATPPQLYSPSSRSQASVITRLTRPPQGRQPFPSGQSPPQRYYAPNAPLPPHSIPSTGSGSSSRPYHAPNVTVASGPRPSPLVPPPHPSGHLPHPMYMRGQPGIYGGYPNIQPPPMHRSLQSIEHASNSPQNFTGPYPNIPFGSYYAAAAAAERRSGAIIGTFEPFDNKNASPHDRLPAYAHPGLGLAALASRNQAGGGGGGDVDDERVAQPGGAGSSEFSGLVSYFSSQQDDLDS